MKHIVEYLGETLSDLIMSQSSVKGFIFSRRIFEAFLFFFFFHVKELPREKDKRDEGNSVGRKSIESDDVEGSVRLGDVNEFDWEDGDILASESKEAYLHDSEKEITVEFTDSPSTTQRKPSRRATAEEKVCNPQAFHLATMDDTVECMDMKLGMMVVLLNLELYLFVRN